MKCCDERRIMQYLDGELPDGQVKKFKEHIKRCKECRTLLVEYDLLFSEFKRLKVVVPQPDFTLRVMSKLPQVNYRKRMIAIRILYIVMASLILIMFALPLVFTLHNLGPLWDGLKIWLEVMMNIFHLIGVCMKTLIGLSYGLLVGIVVLIKSLTNNQVILWSFLLLTLLSEIMFVRYLNCKIEWRND